MSVGPRLARLLVGQPPHKLAWFEGSRVADFRAEFAELQLEQADALPAISGVDKLVANAGAEGKFEDLLAELRAAVFFARLGAERVELLRDEAFGVGHYAPDLRIAFASRGLALLVDVVRGSAGTPSISEPLTEALRAEGLLFRVTYYLGGSLGVPGIGRREREVQERELAATVAAVVDHLRAVPAGATGEVRVGPDRFTYGPSSLEYGFCSGGVGTAHLGRDEALSEQFLRPVRKKAERRGELPPSERSTPFVVAYVSHEHELQAHAVVGALVASTFGVDLPENRDIIVSSQGRWPPAVEDARRRGWGEALRAWHFEPGADSGIDQLGAYLEPGGWARELSAVLVLHGRKVQWLPNPWAVVAEPRLLELGLPLERLGAEHEAWRW